MEESLKKGSIIMTRQTFESSLDDPITYWGGKTKEEVKTLLSDETAEMVGYRQNNPHHCYTLFDHVLHVTAGINPEAGIYTRVAAFFHDIGKPDVAMEKKGHLVFYGHAKRSAEIAAPILKQIGYSETEISLICFYIMHHDDFISWVLPTEDYDRDNPYHIEINPDNMLTHIKESVSYPEGIFTLVSEEKLWKNLLILCRADIRAQAKHVIMDGMPVDSLSHKEEKIGLLKRILPVVMRMKMKDFLKSD